MFIQAGMETFTAEPRGDGSSGTAEDGRDRKPLTDPVFPATGKASREITPCAPVVSKGKAVSGAPAVMAGEVLEGARSGEVCTEVRKAEDVD